MKFKLIMLASIITCSFQSCQTTDDLSSEILPDKVQIVNGRLAFETRQDAINQLTELENASATELQSWEDLNNTNSLRRTIDNYNAAQDTILAYFSPSLAAILNVEKEYQFENTIVWFHNNFVFNVPNGDEMLLSKIKEDPDNENFASFRQPFIVRNFEKNFSAGRVIPSQLSSTPSFKLVGTLDYRFLWDMRHKWDGVSNTLEFTNCLQYKNNSGNWILAGEQVTERRIDNGYAVKDFSWPGTFQYVKTWDSKPNANGYLYMTLLKTSSNDPVRKYFEGTVGATFTGQITSSLGTFRFVQEVQWY